MRVKRQLLFVQGGGKGTHDEWDNNLVESLRQELGQDYEIHYPRMPSEDEPSYALWKATLERVFGTLQHGAILVGHSVGGTILVNGKVLSFSVVMQFECFHDLMNKSGRGQAERAPAVLACMT